MNRPAMTAAVAMASPLLTEAVLSLSSIIVDEQGLNLSVMFTMNL